MIEIEIANRQTTHAIDAARLRAAVHAVLSQELAASVVVSLAIVDGDEIWRLNREYLQHDYTTDVLSFVLEKSTDHLEGQIVCSADMAAQVAPSVGWSAAEELLLYAIHGALHLAGYDDQDEPSSEKMRSMERRYLHAVGVEMADGATGVALPAFVERAAKHPAVRGRKSITMGGSEAHS